MRTKAAILVRQKEPLEIAELLIPPLKEGQVLVEMAYSGVCQTQLNEWKGKKGEDPYLPHTLGHEGSGKVLALGEGVTKVQVGDHVVVSWIRGEGKEAPSTTYLWGDKKVNSGAVSTFLEKAVVAENRLMVIPKEVSLREAALLGCAIPTGSGVVMNEMGIQKGESILVVGAGGVGLSAILAAHSLQASPIVVVDVVEEKLSLARSLGATHTFHATQKGLLSELSDIVKGKGFDYALESAGRKEAMEMAFQAIGPKGLCIVAGNLFKEERIEIDPMDLIRGKKIVGTWGGGSFLERDLPRYIDLFYRDPNCLKPLVSHEAPLEEIQTLFTLLDQGRVSRGFVCFKGEESG